MGYLSSVNLGVCPEDMRRQGPDGHLRDTRRSAKRNSVPKKIKTRRKAQVLMGANGMDIDEIVARLDTRREVSASGASASSRSDWRASRREFARYALGFFPPELAIEIRARMRVTHNIELSAVRVEVHPRHVQCVGRTHA